MLALAALLFVWGSQLTEGTLTKLWRKTGAADITMTEQQNAAEADAGSAAAVNGKMNHEDSPYFAQPDIYNLKSTETLTVLSHIATQQQTTSYTCGPAAAYMVECYLTGALPSHTEMQMAESMGTGTELSSHPGTDVKGICKYFKELGWEVHSSLTDPSPKDYSLFGKWVQNRLKAGTPIMVENVDWGGHWRVIIGYDTMGTDSPGDDVLLMADPFDTTDHLQDGYGVEPAERFFHMWFDAHLFKEGERDRLWVTATPKK